MKAVLDTNILVSGIFFGGVPRKVLDAWVEGHFELLLTPSIFDEYNRTCDRLAISHPGLDHQAVLATVVGHGTLIADPVPTESITAVRMMTNSCSVLETPEPQSSRETSTFSMLRAGRGFRCSERETSSPR